MTNDLTDKPETTSCLLLLVTNPSNDNHEWNWGIPKQSIFERHINTAQVALQNSGSREFGLKDRRFCLSL